MATVTDGDIDWIRRGTAGIGTSLTTALPSGFAVYGVLDLEHTERQDLDLLAALVGRDDGTLFAGLLERDGGDEGEPGAELRLYTGWRYRFRRRSVQDVRSRLVHGPVPDPWLFPEILFPEDRSWIVSTLWDDSWRSVAASEAVAGRIEAALPAFERIDRGADPRTTGREPS